MEAARRLVNRFVADEISYLLRTEEPVFVVGARPVWRVPATLAFPNAGTVGQVGVMDVDVESVQLLVTEAQIESIRGAALDLAVRHIGTKG